MAPTKQRKPSKVKIKLNKNTSSSTDEPKWLPQYMETFAREWLKHEVLLPGRNPEGMSNFKLKLRQCAERREMFAALGISQHRPWTRYFLNNYKRMLKIVVRSARAKTAEEALAAAPPWVREFDHHFGVVHKVIEELRSVPPPERVDQCELLMSVLRAMWRHLRAAGGGAGGDGGGDGGGPEDAWARATRAAAKECGFPIVLVESTWDSVRRVSWQKLVLMQAAGDRPPAAPAAPAPSDWLAIHMALLYGAHSLLQHETMLEYEEMSTLVALFSLVQLYRLEHWLPDPFVSCDPIASSASSASAASSAPPAPCDSMEVRWRKATRAYISRGHTTSMVVLQRRWYELVLLTRGACALYRRGGAPPRPLCRQVALRFPHLLTASLPPWAALVRAGAVFLDHADGGATLMECTDEVPPEPYPIQHLDLHDPTMDDDLVLIEKDIETINLDEFSSDDDDTHKLIIDERRKREDIHMGKIVHESERIENQMKAKRKNEICATLDSELDCQLKDIAHQVEGKQDCSCACANRASLIDWSLFHSRKTYSRKNTNKAINKPIIAEIDLTECEGKETDQKTEIGVTENEIQQNIEKTLETIETGNIIELDNMEQAVNSEDESLNAKIIETTPEKSFHENSRPKQLNPSLFEDLDPTNMEAKIIFSDDEDILNDIESIDISTSNKKFDNQKNIQDEVSNQLNTIKTEDIINLTRTSLEAAAVDENIEQNNSVNLVLNQLNNPENIEDKVSNQLNTIKTEDIVNLTRTSLEAAAGDENIEHDNSINLVLNQINNSENIQHEVSNKLNTIKTEDIINLTRTSLEAAAVDENIEQDNSVNLVLNHINNSENIEDEVSNQLNTIKTEDLIHLTRTSLEAAAVDENIKQDNLTNLDLNKSENDMTTNLVNNDNDCKQQDKARPDFPIRKRIGPKSFMEKLEGIKKKRIGPKSFINTFRCKEMLSFEADKTDENVSEPNSIKKENEDLNVSSKQKITSDAEVLNSIISNKDEQLQIKKESSNVVNVISVSSKLCFEKDIDGETEIKDTKESTTKIAESNYELNDVSKIEVVTPNKLKRRKLIGPKSKIMKLDPSPVQQLRDMIFYESEEASQPNYDPDRVAVNQPENSALQVNNNKHDVESNVRNEYSHSETSTNIKDAEDSVIKEEASDNRMDCASIGDAAADVSAEDDATASIDIDKLLMEVQIPLYRIDDFEYWKNNAANNTIIVPRVELIGTSDEKSVPKNRLEQMMQQLRRWRRPRKLRTAPDMDEARELVCRPLTVDVYRLPPHVVRGYLDKQQDSDQDEPDLLRPRKKVELTDIDEVRRINSGLLTAQVRPIRGGPAAGRGRQVIESDSESDSSSDVDTRRPTSETPCVADNSLTAEELKEVLKKLKEQSTVPAKGSAKSNRHCCPARRHICFNRARARLAARAGKQFVLKNIHASQGAAHAALTCSCCCRRALAGGVAGPDLGLALRALRAQLRALAGSRGERGWGQQGRRRGAGSKYVDGALAPDGSAPAVTRQPSTAATDVSGDEYSEPKERRKPKRRPKSKKQLRREAKEERRRREASQERKEKERQKYTAEEIEYSEWLRQRNICNKYFTINSSSNTDSERLKNTVTVRPGGARHDQLPGGSKCNKTETDNQTTKEVKTSNTAPISQCSDVALSLPSITDINSSSAKQILTEHSYIKTDPVPIQPVVEISPIVADSATAWLPLAVVPKLHFQPIAIQQTDSSDEKSVTSEQHARPKGPIAINLLTPQSNETSEKLASATKSRKSSLDPLRNIATAELMAENGNQLSENQTENNPHVLNASPVAIGNTHNLVLQPAFVTSPGGTASQPVMQVVQQPSIHSVIQPVTQPQINQPNQTNQPMQPECKYTITNLSGRLDGPIMQLWNNPDIRPQLKTLVDTSRTEPGVKYMKIMKNPTSGNEAFVVICESKPENPVQSVMRLQSVACNVQSPSSSQSALQPAEQTSNKSVILVKSPDKPYPVALVAADTVNQMSRMVPRASRAVHQNQAPREIKILPKPDPKTVSKLPSETKHASSDSAPVNQVHNDTSKQNVKQLPKTEMQAHNAVKTIEKSNVKLDDDSNIIVGNAQDSIMPLINEITTLNRDIYPDKCSSVAQILWNQKGKASVRMNFHPTFSNKISNRVYSCNTAAATTVVPRGTAHKDSGNVNENSGNQNNYIDTRFSTAEPFDVAGLLNFVNQVCFPPSEIQILCVNQKKPLLKLDQKYFLITESPIATTGMVASYWTIKPRKTQLSQILLGSTRKFQASSNAGVQGIKETHNADKDDPVDGADDENDPTGIAQPADSDHMIEDNTDGGCDIEQGTLQVACERDIIVDDKSFKRLSDNPLVYAQVLTAVSEPALAARLALRGAPLHLLPLRGPAPLRVAVRAAGGDAGGAAGRGAVDLACPAAPRAACHLARILNSPAVLSVLKTKVQFTCTLTGKNNGGDDTRAKNSGTNMGAKSSGTNTRAKSSGTTGAKSSGTNTRAKSSGTTGAKTSGTNTGAKSSTDDTRPKISRVYTRKESRGNSLGANSSGYSMKGKSSEDDKGPSTADVIIVDSDSDCDVIPTPTTAAI